MMPFLTKQARKNKIIKTQREREKQSPCVNAPSLNSHCLSGDGQKKLISSLNGRTAHHSAVIHFRFHSTDYRIFFCSLRSDPSSRKVAAFRSSVRQNLNCRTPPLHPRSRSRIIIIVVISVSHMCESASCYHHNHVDPESENILKYD